MRNFLPSRLLATSFLLTGLSAQTVEYPSSLTLTRSAISSDRSPLLSTTETEHAGTEIELSTLSGQSNVAPISTQPAAQNNTMHETPAQRPAVRAARNPENCQCDEGCCLLSGLCVGGIVGGITCCVDPALGSQVFELMFRCVAALGGGG